MQLKVEGAAAKIDAVMKFDKAAWRGVQKGVKEATAQVTAEAQRLVPPMGIVGLRRGAGWGQWTYSRDGRDLSYRPRRLQVQDPLSFPATSRGFVKCRVERSWTPVALLLRSSCWLVVKTPAVHPFNANINKAHWHAPRCPRCWHVAATAHTGLLRQGASCGKDHRQTH